MPTYEYGCQLCRIIIEHYHTFAENETNPVHECPQCGNNLVKLFSSPHFIRNTFDTHFNPTVGTIVSSPGEFKSELARKSDEASKRLNLPHNFQPLDLRDKEACGVTDEGLESTYARQVATGKREAKKWL